MKVILPIGEKLMASNKEMLARSMGGDEGALAQRVLKCRAVYQAQSGAAVRASAGHQRENN